MKIKKFKVIQCKYCGQFQIMGGLNFKCKICNKSTQLILKSKFGLNLLLLAHFDTGLQAQKWLKEFQNNKINKNGIFFKTYGAK